MFLDESAFDDDDAPPQRPVSKYTSNDSSRPGTGHSSRGSGQLTVNDVDEEELGTPSNASSRARILAQQREIQLKRRQSSVNGGAMIRSSQDGPLFSSPAKPVDSQRTPAAIGFSAPKNIRTDDSIQQSEFDAAARASAIANATRKQRYADDDEEDFSNGGRPPRGNSRASSTRNERYDPQPNNGNERRSNNRRSDTEEDSDYDRNKRGVSGIRDENGYDSRDRNRRSDSNNNSKNSSRSPQRNDRDRDPRDYRDNNFRGDDRDDRDFNNNNQRGNSSRNNNNGRGGDRDSDRDDYRNNRRNERDNWEGSNNNKRGNYRDDSRDRRNNNRDDRRHGNDSSDNDDRNNGNGSRRSRNDGGGSSRGHNSGRSPPRNRDNEWEPASDRDRRDNNSRGRSDDNGYQKSPARGQSQQQQQQGTPSRNKNRREQEEEEPPAAVEQVFVPPDYSNMRRFLTSPLPKNNGILQCYIRRNKSGTNKLFPIYSLYLKEGDVFLMASRKRPKNKTSNYLISLDQNDLNRSGHNYLGKLRSNFVGTEFQIFDNGVNPKDMEPDEVATADASVRCELGSVMYAANVLGSRGPRKMQVAMPGLDENNQIMKWKDGGGPLGSVGNNSSGGEGDMLSRMKDRNFRDLVYLINKPPRWNEQVGAYVLNFNGRVTMASVKNFQLVDPDEQNAVVLQFGRVGKDEFTMDFQYPISPFQAFAVTLSSFDSKIACD